MQDMEKARPPVSAYMITFNNERTLQKALASLSWADEIIIVDSFSTDRTLEIAARFTDKITQRKWPGFRDQYQFAADLCQHDWALFADADEELAPELIAEIAGELAENVKRAPEDRIAGYYAQRRTWYINRWIMHGDWVPDREIRLYDRRCGRWEGGLHANIHIQGPVAELKHYYLHYTYANISEHLSTIDNYSTTAALEMQQAGKGFSYLHLIGNPVARFLKGYLLKQGFRDGFPGFVIAVATMFYVFIKHAKLRELTVARQAGESPCRHSRQDH